MMKKIVALTALAVAMTFTSCDKDENPSFDVPQDYTFTRAGSSTVAYPGQTARLQMGAELNAAMLQVESTTDQLLDMFENQGREGEDVAPFSSTALNDATVSIKSKVAASADYFSANTVEQGQVRQEMNVWIGQQVTDILAYTNAAAAPGVPGQIFDGDAVRFVDSKGLEYDQLVGKGLIGALTLDQIVNHYLSPAVLDAGNNRADNDAAVTVEGQPYTNMEHLWDEAYGYVFGNSPDGADPLATLGNDDDFINKYIGRIVGNPNFATLGQDIFDQFKTGRAAIVAGDYEARDRAASELQTHLSEIFGIRSVFYLQAAKVALANGEMGTVFHDLSEAYGFIYSLRFTRKAGSQEPYFDRAEVDQILANLVGSGANGLWDITPATLDQLSEQIADRFPFTVEEAAL